MATKKDPAFLMYSNDFLTGTFTMNDAQVGKYIRLLCLQHQKGALSAKDFERVVGTPDPEIEGKFETEKGPSGEIYYFNVRLREEAEKRSQFCASRRDNRLKKQPEKQSIQKVKAPARDPHFTEEAIINNFGMDCPGLVKAWQDWTAFKAEQFRFKFKSEKSEQTAIINLKNLSHGKIDVAIAIIEQSISNGWKGLFQLKSAGKPEANINRFNARVEYANRHNSKSVEVPIIGRG
jgi:hypothetical protein